MPLSSFLYTDDVDDVMAAHMNRVTASTLRGELGEAVSITTQTALTDGDYPYLKLTPNADLDVLMPPAASTNHLQVLENGSGTYTLTVKDDSDTNTLGTIAPNGIAIFIPSLGTAWSMFASQEPYDITQIPVQGGMINGKITTSVASNNLTVAIKTLAGADPSSSDPVYVRIGNTVRSITSALSVTKNAGTNWAAAGSSELATNEIDWFVYLGYNATDGVVIGFSRIPCARTYGDFNTTSTNEMYAAISTITNAASTDEYENIGRFNAVLSAGAGYTWSIPATSIVINRPIFETRWLTWVPTIAGYSSKPTNAVYRYMVRDFDCIVEIAEGSAGTSNATTKTYTAPFTAKTITNMIWSGILPAPYDNGSVGACGYVRIASASNSIGAFRSAAANWTASGNAYIPHANCKFSIGK